MTTNEDARVLDTTLPMLGFHDFMRPIKHIQAEINDPVPMSGTVIIMYVPVLCLGATA